MEHERKIIVSNSPPAGERSLKGTSVRLSLLQSVRLTVPSRDRATTSILSIRCHKPTMTRTVKSKNTRPDTKSHMGGIPLYLYAGGRTDVNTSGRESGRGMSGNISQLLEILQESAALSAEADKPCRVNKHTSAT